MSPSNSNRVRVGRDFVIDALGGRRAVDELSEQLGVNLHDFLEKDEERWAFNHWAQLCGGRNRISISYNNYVGGVDGMGKVTRPYPDITIRLLPVAFYEGGQVPFKSVCSDIGYGQNKHQAKQKVKTWFHTKVLPIIFEYVFT